MLNLTAVALLVVIVVCFVFFPRYNYGHLLSRIERMDGQIARLESGFEKLNILAGDTESRRAAIVGQIDSIATKLNKLDLDLIAFLEHLAETSARVDSLSASFKSLEERQRPGEANAVAAGLAPAAYAEPPLESPSDDLDKAAQVLSSRRIVQMTFEDFLGYLHTIQLPSFPERMELDRLDEERLGRLKLTYSAFRSCLQVIDESEKLLIDELAEKAIKAGEYSEEGREEGPIRLPAQKERETTHVRTLPDGRKRTFRFPIKDHPDLSRLEELRMRATKSLVISLRSSISS